MSKLPYSNDAEQAVLQCCIEDHERLDDFAFLEPDDFYVAVNRQIFCVMREHNERGDFFDLAVLMDQMDDQGVAYLAELFKNRASSVNAMAYARRVLNLSNRRKFIAKYQEAAHELHNTRTDLFSIIGDVDSVVNKNAARESDTDVLTVDDMINHSMQAMEKSQTVLRRGITTNIPEIDCQLGYRMMPFGEITFIGAQSKNGKTLFANTITARCDLQDDECAHIFSVEMPAVGMFNGIVSAMSGVPSNFYDRQAFYMQQFPSKYENWVARWGSAAQELKSSGRVTIDDHKDVDVDYIVSGIRKQHSLMKNKGKKLRMVVIDHAHRLNYDTSKKSMTYAMGDAFRKIKNCAAELDIAVILLGQLNEACKDRDPTAFDILDTSRARHEIAIFIGTRIFRRDGGTYFGLYSDAHRYADMQTTFKPQFVKLKGGVVCSLDEGEYFNPNEEQG